MTTVKFTRPPRDYVGAGVKIPSFLPTKPPTNQSFFNRNPDLKHLLKQLFWPLLPIVNIKNIFNNIFVDGYVRRKVGHSIRRYIKKGNVLGIGIGGGRLIKYIDLSQCHKYGFDIYDISAVAAEYLGKNVTIFIADARAIPLPDNSMDAAVAAEVFEHITSVEKAIQEVYRVLKSNGKLIISIPNNYCYKYEKKGQHEEHVNWWRYQDFIKELSPYFDLLEGQMSGYWLPWFPHWHYSLQIPSHPDDEYYNSNFFYVFECRKTKD